MPLWRLAYPLRNRLRLEFPFRRNQRRQPLADSVSVPFTLSRLGDEISVSFRSVLQACLVWNVSRRSLSNFISQLFVYGAGALSGMRESYNHTFRGKWGWAVFRPFCLMSPEVQLPISFIPNTLIITFIRSLVIPRFPAPAGL